MPSFFIRDRKVLGAKPRRLAAFPSPLIFQLLSASTLRICSRSMLLRSAVVETSASLRGAWVPANVWGNIKAFPGDRMIACSHTFWSSRTFPGQS